VLKGVRKAERPLSTIEIARGVMLCKGMVVDDTVTLRRVAGMVKGVLHRQDGRWPTRRCAPRHRIVANELETASQAFRREDLERDCAL
jgi:hypothetical protein